MNGVLTCVPFVVCWLLWLMIKEVSGVRQVGRYHTHTQMEHFLLVTANNNKDIASLYSIGKSLMGRELWVMKLCAANKSQLGVPNVKLIGNMHGNEPVGREMIINMIQYLIDGYRGGDEEIVGLLSTTKVHLMPSLNPDGYRMAVEGYCTRGPGRDNGRGKDLNRDFPTRLDWKNSDEQPETSAVRRWMTSVQFVLSASLHSGALVVSYPFDAPTEHHVDTLYDRLSSAQSDEEFVEIWKKNVNEHVSALGRRSCTVITRNRSSLKMASKRQNTFYENKKLETADIGSWRATTESITGDDDVFRHLATLYSNNNPSIPLGCGQHEKFNNGIINGALWYPTTGSMQDYNYLFHGCLELTLQISCCKYPFAHMLEAIWHENHRALIKLMGEAQRGVKGVVREKASGRSLAGARVSLEGTNRATTNTTPNGEYWKILLPGKYSLKVEADGYKTAVESFIVPESRMHNTPVVLDVDMERTTARRPAIGGEPASPQGTIGATDGYSTSASQSRAPIVSCLLLILYQSRR